MYNKFYNLTRKPFQLNADPDFFFGSKIHSRALAYMNYGLTQGEGFVVVTGEPGLGKTMLVRQLVHNLNTDNIVIGVMVTSHVDSDETIKIVAATFGIRYEGDDKTTTLEQIKDYFIEQVQQGKRVLLIVDEAQHLPKGALEELRMLADFVVDGIIPFQVFLVGQKELAQTLYGPDMDQFRQRIVATFQLKALTEEETKVYILFRLEKAGWEHNPEFEDAVFQDIFIFTEGIPRKINTFCDRLLLYGYLEELEIIKPSDIEKVIKEILEEVPEPVAHNENINTAAINYSDQLPVDSSLEERIRYLESNLASLHNIVNKERALLRKAILIQLDMEDVFNKD